MAIAHDANSTRGTSWTTGQSSLTWSHTTTGSDRVLFVSVFNYTATARSVSSVTYNGVAMTLVDTQTASVESNNQLGSLWYLVAPATGANNVVVTFSGACDFANAFAASYTGVDQSTPIGTPNKATNASASTTSPTCNATVSYPNSWLVGLGYGRAATHTATGSTTARRSYEGYTLADSNATVSTGSQGLTYGSGTSDTWPAVVVVPVYAVGEPPAGGGSNVPLNVLAPKQGVFLASSHGR